MRALLEKAQGELVNELRGRRYARDRERKFERAVRRTLITRHGEIELMVIKVKSLENGSVMRLLLYIGLEP